MEEPLELWPADARDVQFTVAPKWKIDKTPILWKSGLLLLTTIALIPIILYQEQIWANAYVIFLIVVHVLGLLIFLWGIKARDLLGKGFAIRLAGLAILTGLIYLASKGVQSELETSIFWISLAGIWLLHTGGLFLLHVRGQRDLACPFL